ncbi:MAG: 4-hydroxythreonine-4-phosphate dehydrogenase PdxA, partial [Planctomycetota bacterium]
LRTVVQKRSAPASLPEIVIFGDWSIFGLQLQKLAFDQPPVRLLEPTELANMDKRHLQNIGVAFVEMGNVDKSEFRACQVSEMCGRASYEYVQAAIDAALDSKIDAITTCPINKGALQRAGIDYPGHTEMFAERCGEAERPDRWCMMQYSREITCTFVTVHIGYDEVPKFLSKNRIFDTIELTAEALVRIGHSQPKIVVCGLNPHAGEDGLFGNGEEERLIRPAIERARREGINVAGPIPGDTAFLPWRRQETDAFVCMYHDQGHIPVKALAFDKAVNTSLGLRVLRTSVDHGTAFDIAWQNSSREVDTGSLFAALRLAEKLANNDKIMNSKE